MFRVLIFITFVVGTLTHDWGYNMTGMPPEQRQFLPYQDINHNFQVVNTNRIRLSAPLAANSVDPQNVVFFFVEGPNKSYLQIRNYDLDKLNDSQVFNPDLPIVFIIHGWQNDVNSPVNQLISTAFLENYKDKVNVFIVDWSSYSTYLFYFPSRDCVQPVGEIVGRFIVKLKERYGKSFDDFTLIGHSLGSHVAGCAGELVLEGSDTPLGHIVGLDPAGVGFSVGQTDGRLDKSDADYVEVIHTAAHTLGFWNNIGHADYYPNGGLSQPMCPWVDVGGQCSHGMSYEYYADSLYPEPNNEYEACKCKSHMEYRTGKCQLNRPRRSLMGGFKANKNSTGLYLLWTYRQKPYGKGKNMC